MIKEEEFNFTVGDGECAICGISSFSHSHPRNSKPKDFVKTHAPKIESEWEELEAIFRYFGTEKEKNIKEMTKNFLEKKLAKAYEEGHDDGLELRKTYTEFNQDLYDKARQEGYEEGQEDTQEPLDELAENIRRETRQDLIKELREKVEGKQLRYGIKYDKFSSEADLSIYNSALSDILLLLDEYKQ